MKKNKKSIFNNLGFWIIVSMILGILAGNLMGEKTSMFAPIGDIFIHLIKMVVVPLVAVSIISGTASMGNSKSAGKIGLATFGYYMCSTAIAVTLGLIMGELLNPGIGISLDKIQSMFSNEYADKASLQGFWETIKSFIPLNPFEALVSGNIMQILFFSIFLGLGISSLESKKKNLLINVFDALSDALVFVITKIMYTAPLGVFALMAYSIGTFGFDMLTLIVKLFLTCVFAWIIHTFGIYGLIIKLFSKVSPRKFFSKIYKSQLVALSTASSMATIPVNKEVCEQELGISKETTSFVLPLGATINMDGNAIYYAIVACFFAQMFGIELGIPQYLAIIFTATIGSIGQAGVPGPSFLVVAVLVAANIPIEGLPIIFGVDRIFDMLRTSVNITGDASCAVIVDNLRNTI
ncbi:dicarboxylate/amino acid:cation symporter [Clostridium aestuarii]|uniref:Dicarboxylate/amino acid:cation symporter n=1 Tax=Clostridium aestuarii TaxID=338193 RepID=A0ABT4D086_9CLOT|nr:dicarboxylate/amino acid:cation symporter [Clostridium aestuarii]